MGWARFLKGPTNITASKHLQVTLVTTTSVVNSAQLSECSSVTIASISDGSEEIKETETLREYLKRFRGVFSCNLAKFIDTSSNRASAIIYDSTMPWVQDIARERGLLGAPFFPLPCAVAAVFYHLKQGSVRYPYEDYSSSAVALPALPPLGKIDLPFSL